MFILDLRILGTRRYPGSSSAETAQTQTAQNRLLLRREILQNPGLTYEMLEQQGNSTLISLADFNQLRGLNYAGREAELYRINHALAFVNHIQNFQQSQRNQADQFIQQMFRAQ